MLPFSVGTAGLNRIKLVEVEVTPGVPRLDYWPVIGHKLVEVEVTPGVPRLDYRPVKDQKVEIKMHEIHEKYFVNSKNINYIE